MIAITVAVVLILAAVVYTVFIRPSDLPEPEPISPAQHLEERKARIYEGLRDLQFEYRVGKLSDDDYQRTKTDLQTELAAVLAEIERIMVESKVAPPVKRAKTGAKTESKKPPYQCTHCGASFERPLKFCGECGKPMPEATTA